jgi:hypothetical protein
MANQFYSNDFAPKYNLADFYRGGDQAMAEQQAQEDIYKSQLANILSAGRMPNELAESNLSGAKANQLNNPDYLNWYEKGLTGSYKSQDAAGNLKQAIYGDELAATTQELKNKLSSGQLKQEELSNYLRRIDDLKKRQEAGTLGAPDTMGFPQQQQPEYQSPINLDYGNEGRGLTPLPILKTEGAMRDSMGTDYRSGSKPYDLETIDTEIRRTKDPKILAELQNERNRIVAELGAGGGGEQPTSSVMQRFAKSGSKSGNSFLNGIPGNDPYNEGLMGILMDTPEFRQKLAMGEQKTDSAEEIADKRAQALKEKTKKELADPKYKEQLMQAFKTMANPDATPQEKYEAEMVIHYDRQARLAGAPGGYQGRMDMGAMGIPTKPSPVEQNKMPTPPTAQSASGSLESKVKASGQQWEPNKYEYREGPNGEIQRKLKG